MPFCQLVQELREIYKEKRESMVPKHNEEEQSQDKRKASRRHQCQAGKCITRQNYKM
jgi:hypothetical protein